MGDVVYMKVTVNGADREYEVRGRLAWTLDKLIAAGARGVTTLDRPAPRWSGYVFQLRRDYDLVIETVWERHTGPYKGRHGRYILRSEVTVLKVVEQRLDGSAGHAA